jgi:general secretion pathway protein A
MDPVQSVPLPQPPHSVFANDDCRRPAFVSYFGLRENPFRTTSDPRYLLLTNQTRQALDGLLCGINARAGLLILTGEVGTGKTVLLKNLLDLLRQGGIPRAFLFNSQLETDDLFEMALADFGAPPDLATHTRPAVRLQRWLLDCYRANSNAVLIIDEAQGLKLEVLEAIRMLLNLEPGGEKLLQIVLSGQPEFDTKVNLPELRQLRQRVALRYRLGALTLEETCRYIEHRLRIAGSTGDFPFEPEALAAVHYYAQGIPRVINALCEQALMKACAERSHPVQPKTVEEVAFQFQFDGHKPLGSPVQLGDLMMMNAVAARSKRANARLAESPSAGPSAATSQPEPRVPQHSAGRTEPSPDLVRPPIGAADPKSPAPAPTKPIAASAPVLVRPAVDSRLFPAPTPAPLAAPRLSPPDPIRLPIGVASPKDTVPTLTKPTAASAPVLAKPAVDSRVSPTRTTAPPSARKPPIVAHLPPLVLAHTAKAELSLLASLSSIERVASNWLRWLREPIRSNRAPTQRKTR